MRDDRLESLTVREPATTAKTIAEMITIQSDFVRRLGSH